MSGYVICASCGARIKANRDRCLRCDEPLVAAGPAPILQAPAWLKLSSGRLLMLGVAASLALFVTAAVLWESGSDPADDIAKPAPGAPTASVASKPPAVSVAATTELPAPVTALDSTRVAGVAFTSGDFQGARLRYEQALEKTPDDPETLNNLGLALVRLGNINDAIARFEKAVQLAPDKWAYHFNLARTLGQQQKWDLAAASYRTAARLFPADYATQYNLAMVLHKQGDDRSAIPEFEKAIALAPSEPSFHLSLGISFEKVGRLADARREYQQYLEMDPSAPEADKLKAHIRVLAEPQPSPSRTPATP